jgi:hypothetical protein
MRAPKRSFTAGRTSRPEGRSSLCSARSKRRAAALFDRKPSGGHGRAALRNSSGKFAALLREFGTSLRGFASQTRTGPSERSVIAISAI